MVSGTPASASKGDVIAGLDDVPELIEVTHAATARREDGEIVTAGGRVLNLTALAATAQGARDAAYAATARSSSTVAICARTSRCERCSGLDHMECRSVRPWM